MSPDLYFEKLDV